MSTVEGDIGRPPALRWFVTEPLRGAVSLAGLPFARPLLSRAPRGDGRGGARAPRPARRRRQHRPDPSLPATTRPPRVRLGPRPQRRADARGRRGAADVGSSTSPTAPGQPVSLIGWSLGGILARELARQHPDLVQQVITLASPYMPTTTLPSRADAAYRRRSGQHVASNTPHPATDAAADPGPEHVGVLTLPTASSIGEPASSRRPPPTRTSRSAPGTSASAWTPRCCGCSPTDWRSRSVSGPRSSRPLDCGSCSRAEPHCSSDTDGIPRRRLRRFGGAHSIHSA